MTETRQILEHTLAEKRDAWAAAREAKRLVMQEHNEAIKQLEEEILALLAEIRVEKRVEEAGQQRLPFEGRMASMATIVDAEEVENG